MKGLLINIKSKLQQLIQSKKFAGIELILEGDGYKLNMVVLKRTKGEIHIIKSKVGISDIEELKKEVSEEIPIYLTLNGKGILHRKLEEINSENYSQVLNAILPNSSLNDFYLQTFESNQSTFASILRKNILDDILAKWKTANLWIVQAGLGSFDLRFLASLLPKGEPIHTDKHVLQLNDEGELYEFDTNKNDGWSKIKIGDDLMDSRLFVSYAAAFKGLLDIPSDLEIIEIEQSKNEFFHKRVYEIGSIALACGLIFILLINTGLYYNYKSSNEKFSTQLLLKKTQLEKLDSLKAQLRRQKQLMLNTNINQGTRTSYYADQIGNSLPKEINLTNLTIFPIKGKKNDYDKQELVKFEKEQIRISGQCKSSLIYNQWIKDLQHLDWVKSADHLDYKDVNNKLGQFELKITIASSK